MRGQGLVQEVQEGLAEARATLARHDLKGPDAFRKVASGRKLWNADNKELDAWKAAC